MASLSSGLNPNVVQTALDRVVFQEFELDPGPDVARATDPIVFRQETADSAAEIMEVFKGVGLWDTRAEEEDVPSSTPRVGDQITFTMSNFANSVDISKNFFDDEKHSVVMSMMREFGEKARVTQDRTAYGLYRLGFTTTLTADGAALFSNTHTNLNGDTVDNLDTAALSETALNTGIINLMEQVDQAGVVRGHQANCLLVPPALYKAAVEITDSELRSGTADNDLNVYSAKYGLFVKQSPYLGAASGGSDTAWFLLARNHQNHRWVRQSLVTDLLDWRLQRNNNYIYKGEYREQIGAVTYEGSFGSDGTV
jgi:hypothetical protein